MASKYTPFWNAVVTGAVVVQLREKKKVELPLVGIGKLGNRISWFGKNTFTKEGKVTGGIMAHVKALQYTIPPLLNNGEVVTATCSTKGDALTLTLA